MACRWHSGATNGGQGGIVDIETPPERDPDHIDDDWNRLEILLATAEPSELLDADVSGEQLAFRLFHEDGVRVFEPRGLQFACRAHASACSICWPVCRIKTRQKCNHKKTSKCAVNFVMKITFLSHSRPSPSAIRQCRFGISCGDWFHRVLALYF